MGLTTFVTGGSGLLGTWLVRALLERGDEVVLLRRGWAADEHCRVVEGDILDAAAIDRGLKGVDRVFHLAAQTIVGTANEAPSGTFDVNIGGTWTLLEACRARDIATVVVASSDKAYGAHDALPLTEDTPLTPRYPYDVSKACADLVALSYFHTFGLPVTVTRFANVYGGGDKHASRLIPELISAILAGRDPVIRSDGTPERDYLHVEDAVRALLASAGHGGEVFNAGGDGPHSVREVVTLLIGLTGADVTPRYGTPQAGETDRHFVDSTKLRTQTGWAPQHDLASGLRRTLDWHLGGTDDPV